MDFHAVWCTSLPTLNSATDLWKFYGVTAKINLKCGKSKSFPNSTEILFAFQSLQMRIKTSDILMIMTKDIMSNEVLDSL